MPFCPRQCHSALSRVVCTLLELVPCSPQLALRIQMHELCVCHWPMLVLTAHTHPQGPVYDLMCVPTAMHAKEEQVYLAGAGLLQL